MSNGLKVVRGPKRSRIATIQPTKLKLIETASELIETLGINNLTSEKVLEQSGVSRGSLYHHFEDFSDLLEQALVRKFAALVDINVAAMTALFNESTSREDLFAGLHILASDIHSLKNNSNRYFRARIIALAETNERLLRQLSVEQTRLNAALTELFAGCQRKGWMNRDFNPATAAIFVQAYTLGQVINHISSDRVSDEQWSAMVDDVLQKLFG